MGVTPLDCYAKEWDPVFSTDRDIKEDWSQSYVDQKRAILANFCDGIELFFRDSDASIPDCKVEELLEFAASLSLEDLKAGSGSAGLRRGSWLDERSSSDCNTSAMREHKNPLTATQIYERLKTRRIGNESAPDANRRLVYIENLDPSYVLALAETARFHEVPLLRDALFKHLTGRTLLKVRIPTKGYKIFQLQFHLKHFVLRTWPPVDETDKRTTASNPPNKWTDLSFLEIQTPKAQEGRKYGMFEARFSVVICGSQEGRWTAYAFDDTEFDGEDLYEKMMGNCQPFHADPIASCIWGDDVNADIPIWNPREYFLIVVANRIARAANDWESLVGPVERSIREYRERNPSTLSRRDGSTKDRGERAKKAFDWTRQIKEFLSRLRDPLSATIKFWERFNSSDGDIGFFLDVNSSDKKNRVNLALREIKETFETLEELQRTLDTLVKSCDDYANALQLRLTLEANEATKSNVAATDFTLFVLGPPALAAACLQLPPAIVPLPPSRESFVTLTIIFMIAMKILFAICGALPGIWWWWNIIKVLVKAMNLEDLGNPLSVCAFGRHARKHRSDIDSMAQDVEMAPG